VTFDEALAHLLALVGERVEVHVMDAGETPQLVATFGGRLQAGYSMTGGEPSDTEAIFVRLDAGEETAAISLNREVFEGGLAHEDGAITLQLGGVEFVIARRSRKHGRWQCRTSVTERTLPPGHEAKPDLGSPGVVQPREEP
jgi:hypothetical protein